MSGSRSLNNSVSKIVLDRFEPVKLTVWKVYDTENCSCQVSNGRWRWQWCCAGCFEMKVSADTAKYTDVIARVRKCRNLIRECMVFVKDEAEVASGVGCSERGIVYFRQLLFF